MPNIDDKINILLSFSILVPLIIIRVIAEWVEGSMSLVLMSAVNAIAFIYVILMILYKVYLKMESKQKEYEAQFNANVSKNSDMKKFDIILTVISGFLIICSGIYIYWFGSNLINDILTVLSLVISVQDEAFVNKIYEISYKSYYGSKVNNYIENL